MLRDKNDRRTATGPTLHSNDRSAPTSLTTGCWRDRWQGEHGCPVGGDPIGRGAAQGSPGPGVDHGAEPLASSIDITGRHFPGRVTDDPPLEAVRITGATDVPVGACA